MNKTKLKVALLGALLVCGVAVAQTPQEVTAKFAQAAELYNAQKYAEAVPMLEETIKMGLAAGPDALETVKSAQSSLTMAYFRTGLAAAQANNFTKAEEDLAKAYDLAELYGNAQVKTQATTMLSQVYMADGGSAFNNKDYEKAIGVFSKGFAKFPTNSQIGLLLARSYAESGDMVKAGETYQKIITGTTNATAAAEAKKELATYILISATEAAKANDLDEVVRITDEVLEFDPTNSAANLMRLQTAIGAKKYDAAIGFGEAAIEAQTTPADKSEVYFLLGAAYQNKLNAAKAIEMYNNVTEGNRVAEAKAQIAALK